MPLARLSSDRFAQEVEFRSSLENPQSPLSFPSEWLLDLFSGGRTDAGIRVSELTAFQCSTFLACVDLIAGSLASLPIQIYENIVEPSGRTKHRLAAEHDFYDVVNMEPNVEMTTNTLIKTFMIHCLAWGNGYIEIQRDKGNGVVALWPRNPWKTRPRRLTQTMRLEPEPWRPFPVTIPAGTLVYRTTDGMDDSGEDNPIEGNRSASERYIPAEDMIHVPGMAFDGRIGQSVVWLARQTLGLSLAMEKFGAKYFANFARPGGLLELPANLAPEAKEEAKRSWMQAQGGENSHRIAVMPPGFKWTSISNDPEKSQLTDAQRLMRQQIAAFMHVPPHMVGDVDKGSKSTIEQEATEFVTYTLMPWISAIKPEYKRKLFGHPNVGRRPKNPFFIEFDLTDWIRPDAAAREKFNASGKQWGYLNTNDIRALEKLNPVEDSWAEEYWMPVNMTLVSTPINPNNNDGAGHGGSGSEPKLEPAAKPVKAVFGKMFRDAISRFVSRDKRDEAVFLRCFAPVLYSLRSMFTVAACMEMRIQAEAGTASDTFVAEYARAMSKRSVAWVADDIDAICAHELESAARALRNAAYEEIAALKRQEPLVLS